MSKETGLAGLAALGYDAYALAVVGYTAYGEAADWKTFDGLLMPTADDLRSTEAGCETLRRWARAANAIVAESRREQLP